MVAVPTFFFLLSIRYKFDTSLFHETKWKGALTPSLFIHKERKKCKIQQCVQWVRDKVLEWPSIWSAQACSHNQPFSSACITLVHCFAICPPSQFYVLSYIIVKPVCHDEVHSSQTYYIKTVWQDKQTLENVLLKCSNMISAGNI